MEDEASDKVGSITGKIKSGFAVATKAVAAGVAAATAAVGVLMKSSIDGYAKYEQLVGGVETLFKNSSNMVIKYADNAYKTAGMSANQYMETVTSFSASLLQGLGGDTAAAAEIADQAITDMADNANKMGTSISMIQDAYQGFAKQNYTMLDNLKLGYGGTATEMARLINDSGVLGDTMKVTAETVNQVSFDKIIEAIHKVQTEIGITGTTAKEASTTIEGSANSMKSAWSNLVTGMANENANLNKLVENFVDSFMTYMENLSTRILILLPRMSEGLKKLMDGLASVLPGFVEALLPALISGVVSLLSGLVSALPEIIQIITGMIPTLFNLIVSELPNTLPALVGAVTALIQGLANNLPLILTTIAAELPNMIRTLCDVVTKNVGLWVDAAIDVVLAIVDAAPDILSALIDELPNIIESIIEAIVENAPKFVECAESILDVLITELPTILLNLVDKIPELVFTIIDAILANLPAFINAVVEIVQGIIVALPDIILLIIEQLPTLIYQIIVGILESIPEFVKAVWEIAWAIITAIPEAIAKIGDKITESIITVTHTIKALWPKFKEAALEWLRGVMEGLKDLPDRVKSIGDQVPGKILEGIRSAWNTLVAGVSSLVDSFVASMEAKLRAGLSINVKTHGGDKGTWSGGGKPTRRVNGSYASGLDYVPFDGYIAELHEGEMVLTSRESDLYRKQSGGVVVNQYIYSEEKNAADLMREAYWMQERAVLMGV